MSVDIQTILASDWCQEVAQKLLMQTPMPDELRTAIIDITDNQGQIIKILLEVCWKIRDMILSQEAEEMVTKHYTLYHQLEEAINETNIRQFDEGQIQKIRERMDDLERRLEIILPTHHPDFYQFWHRGHLLIKVCEGEITIFEPHIKGKILDIEQVKAI